MQHYQTTGPTLTNITKGGRQAVKFGSIALVALIFGRILLNAGVAYWKAIHPEPPPPPTEGFGTLPQIEFPAQVTEDKPGSYSLELPKGSFPDFGDRAKVYFMPKPSLGLLSDQKAKRVAEAYGYETEPEVIGTDTYRWSKNQSLFTTLEFNPSDSSFTYTTDYLSKPELLLNANLPNGFDAVQRTKRFLELSLLLPPDVATSAGEIVYRKSLGGELVDAVSASDADFIEVDLTRYPIDGKYRMYTPEGLKGTIHATLTGAVAEFQGVVEFEFNHHELDYTQVHTYPLRSPREAWQVLQGGEGYIANKGTTSDAIVRDVELAYYDDFEYQQYLQPVYVFKGDNGFLGYVSALGKSLKAAQ